MSDKKILGMGGGRCIGCKYTHNNTQCTGDLCSYTHIVIDDTPEAHDEYLALKARIRMGVET